MNSIVPFTSDNSQEVITSEQLAEEYGVTSHAITVAFNRHKERFHEGKDYILAEGEHLKVAKANEAASQFGKHAAKIYLWTKHGAFIHATLINTDKAWDAYEHRYVSSAQVQALILAQQEHIKALQERNEKLTAIIAKGLTIPSLPANTLNNVSISEAETATARLRQLIKPFREYIEKAKTKRAVYLSHEEAQALADMLASMHENLNKVHVQITHQDEVMLMADMQSIKQQSLIEQITEALELPLPPALLEIQAAMQALPEPN